MDERSVEGIRDVFRCFICMEKLENAQLCPHCSKLCCFGCICRWLTEQRPQCPHCRKHLRVTDLVKCRWVEEITQKLDSIGSTAPTPRSIGPEQEKCNIHQEEKLSVFCWDCQSCICHHCALWGGQHSGHTLKPLEDEYNVRVDRIGQDVKKLRRRLCLLIQNLQELEENIEEIRKGKDERVKEIRCSMDLMISRLEVQMKDKLVSLTGQKRTLSMEVEMVEGILTEVEHQLVSASHSSLVQGSSEIFKMLAQIQRSSLAPIAQVPPEFLSEVVPPYESQCFVVTEFGSKRSSADPVYSDPLVVNGLTWRLKVYPDGNGAVRGSYISVFLELTRGPQEPSRYEYRVEMIHQQSEGNPGQNIVREFASEFEVGECWGYNRFFKVDNLVVDGFLDVETDCLLLKFHVRPPTFYQKSKDLLWYIKELEKNASVDDGLGESVVLDPGLTNRDSVVSTEGDAFPHPEDNLATDSVGAKEEAHNVLEVSTTEKDVEEEGEHREATAHTDNDVEDEVAVSSRITPGSGGSSVFDWANLAAASPRTDPIASLIDTDLFRDWCASDQEGSSSSLAAITGNAVSGFLPLDRNELPPPRDPVADSISRRLNEQLSRWTLSSEEEESSPRGTTTARAGRRSVGQLDSSHFEPGELFKRGNALNALLEQDCPIPCPACTQRGIGRTPHHHHHSCGLIGAGRYAAAARPQRPNCGNGTEAGCNGQHLPIGARGRSAGSNRRNTTGGAVRWRAHGLEPPRADSHFRRSRDDLDALGAAIVAETENDRLERNTSGLGSRSSSMDVLCGD